MVSIPGGEPLIHKEIDKIVEGIVARKKFVYLCTNALLLEKKLHLFKPSPYLTFSIHLDGLEKEHDRAVDQEGVFERAVKAIRAVREKGFRCNVNSTFFNNIEANEAAAFFDFCATLGVEGITVSPGYSYERAPDQEHFLTRRATKQLYRDVLKLGKGKKWPLSQSSLFLDFLAGNQTYRCTPWGNPTRNIFGWQRPCYLLGEGYVKTFAELLGGTDWEKYGTGAYEKCSNCMVHCGYEPTAVEETFTRPWKALWVRLRGVRTDGPMAPEIAFDQARSAEYVFEENVEKALSKVERKDGGGQSHAA
jgi:hopanoid biosynthesis associated radical SAM protein HpnH